MAPMKATARSPYAPRYRHGWYQSIPGCRLNPSHAMDNSDPNSPDVLVVPSHFALGDVQLRKNTKTIAFLPDALPVEQDVAMLDSKYVGSPLLELPTEVLLHIFRFLLRTGQVFHFTPTAKRGIRATSVHRLWRTDPPDANSGHYRLNSLSTYSTTCHRLMEVVYTTFYGENQFVFEIAAVDITANVQQKNQNVTSESKVIRTKPEGIAPLSRRTAQYLSSLTVCVSLTGRWLGSYERKRLQYSVQSIADMFEGSDHDLKTLVLDSGIAKRTIHRTTTARLEVVSASRLHMQVKRDASRYTGVPNQTLDRLRTVIAPLLALVGLKSRRFTGLLTDEMVPTDCEEGIRSMKRAADSFEMALPAKRQCCETMQQQ